MKAEIYHLDLPEVPKDLHNKLVDFAEKFQFRQSQFDFINQVNKYELKLCHGYAGLIEKTIDKNILNELHKLYDHFFNDNIMFVLHKMSNLSGEKYAVVAPHIDRGRNIAINYILETGGQKVYTCFYEKESIISQQAQFLYYKDLKLLDRFCFNSKAWHSYKTQQYHGVENIETSRYIFSIIPKKNLPIDIFFTEHQHLIGSVSRIGIAATVLKTEGPEMGV